MKRRDFVKNSLSAATLPFWLQSCDFLLRDDFPIHVRSDHGVGHLLMESTSWPMVSGDETETIIVGGGLAGLSAAYSLKDKKFKLYELSDRLGGTSGAIEGLNISQGAHYELAYPEGYGPEVLKMLADLDIIEYESWKSMWTFKDRQHIIPFARRQRCYEAGRYRNEVISAGSMKDRFYEILKSFDGQMPLPTRLIDEKYHHLNEATFLDFLNQEMSVDEVFIRQLDYHMMDDWGARTSKVSALAGIHYFMCRPYLEKSVDLFSPPQGNAYFAEKILSRLSLKNIHTEHLIAGIEKVGEGFEVSVLDVRQKRKVKTRASRIIYAGQKHALKYIYPKEANLFSLEQAPWMVLNFLTKQEEGRYGYWQNEFLGENPDFLGFIDSSVQDRNVLKERRVFTGYYCLNPEDRNYLTTIPENKDRIAAETLEYISESLGERPDITECHINVMGHAMAIPKLGFLLNDANEQGTDLIYAGVDNGRLPLLYEALDSGLMAGKIAAGNLPS